MRLDAFGHLLAEATSQAALPPQTLQLASCIEGEDWLLQAEFAELRPSGLVGWRYADTRAGDYLQAWLQHLALCALAPEGVARRTRWLSRDGEFVFTEVADA